jgi:hypothetical protein
LTFYVVALNENFVHPLIAMMKKNAIEKNVK